MPFLRENFMMLSGQSMVIDDAVPPAQEAIKQHVSYFEVNVFQKQSS